eukprot:694566-Prorocentrum_lima.AAC.1
MHKPMTSPGPPSNQCKTGLWAGYGEIQARSGRSACVQRGCPGHCEAADRIWLNWGCALNA